MCGVDCCVVGWVVGPPPKTNLVCLLLVTGHPPPGILKCATLLARERGVDGPESANEARIRDIFRVGGGFYGWVGGRTLGAEAYRTIIKPIVSGIYVGDPSRLSARTTLPKLMRMEGRAYELGWNVRGALLYGGLAMRWDAAAGSGEGMPSSSSSLPTEEEEERRNDKAEDRHHHHHHPPPHGYDDYHGRPGSYKTGLIALPNAIMDELGPSRVRLS